MIKNYTNYLFLLLAVVLIGCSSGGTPTSDVIADTGGQGEIADGIYVLNSERSTLTWEASRLAARPHTGTVKIREGQLARQGDVFTSGAFTIDMSTITDVTNNQRFLGHIKGDDFFAVDQFPTSQLVIKGVEQTGTTYTVTGDLTIRDQTHEIIFPATIARTATGLSAQAQFNIDRTRWGITFGSGSFFQDLGDRAIKDEITYDLNVVFELQL